MPRLLGLLEARELCDYGDDEVGWSIRYSPTDVAVPKEFDGILRVHAGRAAAGLKSDVYLYRPPGFDASGDALFDHVEDAFHEAVRSALVGAESGLVSRLAVIGDSVITLPLGRKDPNWFWAGMRVTQPDSPHPERWSHLLVSAHNGWVVKVRYTYPDVLAGREAHTALFLFVLELQLSMERFDGGREHPADPGRGTPGWQQDVAAVLSAPGPLIDIPGLPEARNAGLPLPALIEVSPVAAAETENAQGWKPEIAYLGNAQALTLAGMQAPNAAVMSLLDDGEALKSLLLFFDGLAVLGLGVADGPDGRPRVRLAPARPLPLGGVELYADISFPVDDLTSQLIEVGLLQCIEPQDLVTDHGVDVLLDRFITGACDVAASIPRDTAVADVVLDAGPLSPLMSEDIVRWVFEELAKLRLAEVREHRDIITVTSKDGKTHSAGATTVRVPGSVGAAFRFIADQVIRDAGHAAGVVLSPLQVGSDLGRVGRKRSPNRPFTVAELTMLQLAAAHVDLTHVTFDEIISYRRENETLRHRSLRMLRERVALLASQEAGAADNDVRTIEAELMELSREFDRSLKDAFGAAGVDLTLGIAGAATDVATGNPAGAAVALLQTLRAMRNQDDGPDVYSYVLRARKRLPR
ncbi:MAG: hypothetical protein QOH76_3943 [Thermoleophilaceae bacterium]|nr:hypothetical protein [Thermoleophilaceae bacterium]